MKLLQDRRLEVALKSLGKMGDDLGRLTELLEELSGQVRLRFGRAYEVHRFCV